MGIKCRVLPGAQATRSSASLVARLFNFSGSFASDLLTNTPLVPNTRTPSSLTSQALTTFAPSRANPSDKASAKSGSHGTGLSFATRSSRYILGGAWRCALLHSPQKNKCLVPRGPPPGRRALRHASMQESVRTTVSVWVCPSAETSYHLEFMSSPLATYRCVHKVGTLAPHQFLKFRGRAVWRIWNAGRRPPLTQFATVAINAVFPTRKSAKAAARKMKLVGKKVVLSDEHLPDLGLTPKPDQGCDLCPLRCLWPGCRAVQRSDHDLAWHQAAAHGIWQVFPGHDACRASSVPAEMWALVADKLRPRTIEDVTAMLPTLWASQHHPLIAEMRLNAQNFLASVNARYNSNASENLGKNCWSGRLDTWNLVDRSTFAAGFLEHCRSPLALMTHLKNFLPLDPNKALIKRVSKDSDTSSWYRMAVCADAVDGVHWRDSWNKKRLQQAADLNPLLCLVDSVSIGGEFPSLQVQMRTLDWLPTPKHARYSAMLHSFWNLVIEIMGEQSACKFITDQ